MREIKFRAWDTKAKAMSPDFVLFGEFTLMGAVHDWQSEVSGERGDSLGRLNDLEIMQFTGLLDKSGKEIYESDLIELDGKFLYEVIFENGSFVLIHRKGNAFSGQRWGLLSRCFDPDFAKYEFLVKGNIYQNPELLTNGKEA